MRNPLKVVHADDAPDTLIDAWVLTMTAQGLSTRTITERQRVIRQLARATGTDPAALTPTPSPPSSPAFRPPSPRTPTTPSSEHGVPGW